MKHFLLFFLIAVALMLGSRTSKAQLAAPTNVTATPSLINAGSSSNLNATSVGNQINWYTVATGGTLLNTVNSTENYEVSPSSTTTYYAEAYNNGATALPLAGSWNTSAYGLFFDITTGNDPVSISGFTWQSNAGGGKWNIRVYTKNGTYSGSETNSALWTNQGNFDSSGSNPQDLNITPITIPANTTYGFLIFGPPHGDFLCNNQSSTISDSKITVTSGKRTGSNPFSMPGIVTTLTGSVKYATGIISTSTSRTPVTVTVNQAPTNIALSSSAINENVAANTTVGTLSTTDPDAGNTFTYSLVAGTGSTDNAWFNISGSSLRINNSPDFETKNSYSVRVRTTDQGGLYYEKALTVTINNVNETPTNLALSASSINENLAANTTVGNLSSTDVDAGNTFTYTLVAGTGDTDNASFNIIGSSLRISNSPDFESKSSYSVRVRTTDQGGLSFEKALTVTINNVNETPTNLALSASSINENVAANTTVGTLSTTDPDAGNTFTYSLVAGTGSTDNASFTISGLDLRISNSPDFETKNSYSVRVRTTDQGGLSFEKALTVTINNVNEAPLASTIAATNVSVSGATLNGSINANNLSTTVTFEYGLTTAYGSSVTADQSPVTGSSSTPVSKTITGLASGTTYHYRVKGVSADGTTNGADMTFATTPTAPNIISTPTLTIPYGKPYNYSIQATKEGTSETSLTAPTKPSWLSFNTQGQNQATLLGSIPSGIQITGVAGDNDGNIYAIDRSASAIYKIEADGTTTVWKSNLLTSQVYGLHIANGYIYIPRYLEHTQSITRVPLSDPSAVEETFASGILGGTYSLNDKDGWIYAGNVHAREIYRINETTKEKQLLLDSSKGMLTSNPYGLTFGNDGNLYIATGLDRTIIKYDGTKLLTGTPGTPTTVRSGLPGNVGSIRQDKSGHFYVSMMGFGVRKYPSDFSSFQVVSLAATDNVNSLSLTASGALVYSKHLTTEVYRLHTGAILAGTPAKSNVGDHAVVVRAINSVGSTDQHFTIKVVDIVAPVITAQTPANNATNVALKPTLSLTFDEAVNLGDAGTLTLYNGGTLLKSFDLSVPEEKAKVVLAVNRLSISVELTENLPINTLVTVGISAGFVKDDHNNNFTGFTAASNTWRFTTINKNLQTIGFPAITAKTYGDASFTLGDAITNQNLTVTYTAEDPTVVSITGNQATILKAGTTKITATQAGDDQNFAATPVEQTLTVNKATLTVTADVKTKEYGEANPALTFQYSGWKNNETETVLDTKPTVSTTVNQSTNVGTHTGAIVVSGGVDNNYTFSYVPANMSVIKALLTVTADAKTKVYGEANPALTFQYSGWKNNETETVLDTKPTVSTTVNQSTNVGTHTDAIVVSGGVDNNYTFSYVPANMEVTKATLTVTADAKTKVYAEANPALTFQYSGWKNLETETVLDTNPTVSTTVDLLTNVGTHTDAIVVSGGVDNNYTFSYVPANMEVTKATLTVTADAKTKEYGEANPALTFQYSGWKNNETETVLDTKPTVSTIVDLLTNVGTHSGAIVVSGGVDNNYNFSYVPANMEVTKATLTVTADAKTKVYGAANPALTFQYSGWKNNETETVLDTKPTVSTTVNQSTNVGTHTDAIVVSGGVDNNYTFSYVPANMEVTKATLTVTADAKTKVYAEANPALTFQYSGWKNTDNESVLDTKPTVSTTVDLLTNVGTHSGAIVVSGGVDNNYTFSYVPANMGVTQAMLTVTADAKTKSYGAANPALTFQYSGWKNTDNETVLDTKPTASTTVGPTTNIGTYPGAIVVAGGVDNNYTFSYVPANMEVTRATLTVTADAKTKYYGEANPVLTFQYSGWINNDDETVLDTKPTASTTVGTTTSIGTYPGAIVVSGGVDNNYAFNYVPANMDVIKAIITVTADAKTKEYGEDSPLLTFKYSGWRNGENETVLDTKPTISTTVDRFANVGTYSGAIVVSGAVDNNYTFNYVPAVMEVKKATLTVTADNKTKAFGEANPKLTFQYSGWVNGEEVIDISPLISTTVNQSTAIGNYAGAITLDYGFDNNYFFKYVAGDFEVTGPKIAGDTNGDGKITAPETAGDKNGNGIIDGNEVGGDTNGNGVIDGSEIAGDKDGNGKIDGGEIAGDKNNDGKITAPELAGDKNGNGIIDGNEVGGDTNGNGVIDGSEIAGDKDGNGKIDGGEIAGDKNNDGKITAPELAGDKNGNGIIDGNEVGGDTNGNGVIDGSEIDGDKDGNGKIDGGEIAGDKNNDGKITAPELAGDKNGNGIIDGNEVGGDTNGNGTIDGSEIAGDKDGNGKIDGSEIAGDKNNDGKITAPELAGDKNGNGIIDGNEVGGDTNGNGVIDGSEIAGDKDGNGKIDGSEIAGDKNNDGKITAPELAGDKNGNGIIDGNEVGGDTNGNGVIDGSEIAGDTNGNGKIDGSEIAGDKNNDGKITAPELAGDKNGNGIIDGNEVGGDTNGNGVIDGIEVAGDKDGNGKIDGSEIAGDKNNDGKITAPELNGDNNGNGVIDGNEKPSWPTGIDDTKNAGSLSAYSIRNTEIRLKGQVSAAAVATLIDMQGRTILVKDLEEGTLNSIPTPYIKTGTYLLMVKDEARIQIIKVPVRE